MMSKTVFFVAAMAGAAIADSACSSATATITAAADATALAACSTVHGSVFISEEVGGTLDLSGIGQITGDLVVYNASTLNVLQSSTLNSIGGTFNLTEATGLSGLNFDQLSEVGAIYWQTLPLLSEFSFGANTIASSGSVVITDTFLSDLSTFALETCSGLDINNNNHLSTVSLPLKNATGDIKFQANGNSEQFSVDFPNLEWALSMSFSNCSSISMPALASVNQTIGFYSNYLQSVSTPNLTETGSDLSFVANVNLMNVSMPLLETVGGGFLIANNTAYKKVSFPDVKKIAGALDFSGNFTDVSLPSLDEVDGAFNLQSSGDINCSPFDKLHSTDGIQGKYTCKSASDDVQSGTGDNSGSSTGTATSSSASATSTKKGDAGNIQANLPIAMVIAAAAGLVHLEL